MLGHFPSPHPDELLYSVCARFSNRVAYSSVKAVLEELFGASTATATVALPDRISHLAAALPVRSTLTADRLIEKHSLFSFFGSFLPHERANRLREDMKRNSGQAAYMRSGIMANRVPMPDYLKYCSSCARDDQEQFGEKYWHRLHQLPGVEVCPSHNMLLDNGEVRLRAQRQHLVFVSADQGIRTASGRHIDITDEQDQILLKIASDATWLLAQPSLGTNPQSLYTRYLRLLIDCKLANYLGKIHVDKLLDRFKQFYSPSLLKLLHCEFTGSDQIKTNWLLRLVRHPKHSQHPLYHLLLIQFLGCTAEEFFHLPFELSLFGDGPWPCLNPAADHHKRSVIMELRSGKRLRDNKPVGIFCCECGFTFARTGPDSSPEDRFHIGKMISFGPIWEAKLKELWRDSSLSLSEVGRRLGVDPLTVRRHATRLNLAFSYSVRSSKPLNRATQLKGNHTSTVWAKKRRTYRAKWLSVMKRNRNVTLKTIRQKFPRIYAWLRQNDVEWLEGHRPPSQRQIQSTSSVDWKKRDAKYAVAVRAIASSIKDAPGRPVKVTKTAIGRTIGAITLLQQKLYKMPLTAQILAGVLETREQYAVRRVWWAVELYRQEYVLPRKWQLVMKAKVYSLRETSAVKCALEDALNMLGAKLSQSQAGRAES